MIFTVLCGLLFGSDGYFVALAWSSCALMFFIVSILSLHEHNPLFNTSNLSIIERLL